VAGGTPGAAPGGFAGDPFVDADGDGVGALVEYGSGTSDSEAGGIPETVIRFENGNVVFEVPRNESATDVSFEFEISIDLVNWADASFAGWVGPGVARYETPYREATLFGRARVQVP
jgi:hypothetical protein